MYTKFNLGSAAQCGRFVLVAAVAGILVGTQMLAGRIQAEETKSADSKSVTTDNDSVSLEAHHHYQSAAERANDALLITEVKSGLAKDGVADRYPVAVDCDHGKIRLSGTIGSAQDARHAGDIAADVPGVIAVVNQLTWRK